MTSYYLPTSQRILIYSFFVLVYGHRAIGAVRYSRVGIRSRKEQRIQANLMERVCPECRGELAEGVFVVTKGEQKGEVLLSALLCDPCGVVYEAP